MSIRNENITAYITPNDTEVVPFEIFHAYVEGYTVYGKTAEGESTSYMLRFDDELSLRRPEPEPKRPTHAGQVVRDTLECVGITTTSPHPRAVKIAVQFVGGSYPVMTVIDELEVIDLPTD